MRGLVTVRRLVESNVLESESIGIERPALDLAALEESVQGGLLD